MASNEIMLVACVVLVERKPKYSEYHSVHHKSRLACHGLILNLRSEKPALNKLIYLFVIIARPFLFISNSFVSFCCPLLF